jgi:hypothetical protein
MVFTIFFQLRPSANGSKPEDAGTIIQIEKLSTSVASVSTIHSTGHYTSATSLPVMVFTHTAPLFLSNIFTWELDRPNCNGLLMFQLCAAEQVNTDHHFSIHVYSKSGLRRTVISLWETEISTEMPPWNGGRSSKPLSERAKYEK